MSSSRRQLLELVIGWFCHSTSNHVLTVQHSRVRQNVFFRSPRQDDLSFLAVYNDCFGIVNALAECSVLRFI